MPDEYQPPQMRPFAHYLLEFFSRLFALFFAGILLFLVAQSYVRWQVDNLVEVIKSEMKAKK